MRAWVLLGCVYAVAVVWLFLLAGAPVGGVNASGSRSGSASARLPLAARALVSRTVARDESAFRAVPVPGGFVAHNAPQGLLARFRRGGVLVRAPGGSVGLSLVGWGRGASLVALTPVWPRAAANQVSYERGGVREWYANGPLGLEQGFTVGSRLAGSGGRPLRLELQLSGAWSRRSVVAASCSTRDRELRRFVMAV
jgi:trimeric autotransporter adhesin